MGAIQVHDELWTQSGSILQIRKFSLAYRRSPECRLFLRMRVILKEFKKSQSDILQKQQKSILERTLPESLKLAIARRIENNLFSRVNSISFFPFIFIPFFCNLIKPILLFSKNGWSGPFSGLIRSLFWRVWELSVKSELYLLLRRVNHLTGKSSYRKSNNRFMSTDQFELLPVGIMILSIKYIVLPRFWIFNRSSSWKARQDTSLKELLLQTATNPQRAWWWSPLDM